MAGANTPQDFLARRGSVRKVLERAFPWIRPDNRTGKPVGDINYTGYEPRVQYPRLAMPYWAMYETMYMCAPARTLANQLAEETFRNRGHWKQRFAVKCLACGLEMDAFPKDGLCARKSCRSTVMVREEEPGGFGYAPDDDELAFINHGRTGSEWRGFTKVNKSGKSWWDLMRMLAFDLCVCDDAYLVCIKKYYVKGNGEVFGEPVELVRGHPNVIRPVADDYGNMGGVFYVCRLHRQKVYTQPNAGTMGHSGTMTENLRQDTQSYEGGRSHPTDVSQEKCGVFDAGMGRVCGLPLENVHFVATDSGGAAPKQYYLEDECLHFSYFSPSVLFGTAPVITLYREMRSLIKMSEYIQTYFEKRRIPRGIVAVNTPRKENIKLLKQEVNRESDDNQHDIPFLAVEGNNQRGWIEFIPFADKLNEMDLQALRDEMRMTLGAFYGVSPIFQGDMSQGGGLNNEGLQITVTNRSIQAFQHKWNEEVFPWVAKQFGIKDHEFVLDPSEEKDMAHEMQLELLKQQVLMGKTQNGLKFLGIDEEGNYVTEDKPTPTHPSQIPFLTPEEQMALQAQQMGGDPNAGGVQPGGTGANPVGSEKQDSLTEEVGSEPDGAPLERGGGGEEGDLF